MFLKSVPRILFLVRWFFPGGFVWGSFPGVYVLIPALPLSILASSLAFELNSIGDICLKIRRDLLVNLTPPFDQDDAFKRCLEVEDLAYRCKQ